MSEQAAPAAGKLYSWKPRARNYNAEWELHSLKSQSTVTHPLLSAKAAESARKEAAAVAASASSTTPSTPPPKQVIVDPLSALSAASSNPLADPLGARGAGDPLSGFSVVSSLGASVMGLAAVEESTQIIDWEAKKKTILRTYTTDRSFPIVSKIVDDAPAAPKSVSAGDKVKSRLEMLEKNDEEASTSLMTQKECIAHIERLHEQLHEAWSVEDRVRALKIVIQCCKILNETSVPHFYPSIFVLIAEVLDSFGRLVFERILSRGSRDPRHKVPENFTPDMISEDAKETCRNWFYKIASIRELLPRVYVETAIFKCNRFLTSRVKDMQVDMARLAKCARGIGDPLVATYLRAYIARKGSDVLPTSPRDYVSEMYSDALITTERQWKSAGLQKQCEDVQLPFSGYIELYTPAFEYLVHCLTSGAKDATFEAVTARYEAAPPRLGTVLNVIIDLLPAQFIASNAARFIRYIKEADCSSIPRHILYRTLGQKLIITPPPETRLRMALMNEVWKYVSSVQDLDPAEYLSVAEVYIEYVLKYLTEKQVNVLLGDIVHHVQADKAYEKLEPQLKNVVSKVFALSKSFIGVFAMENFLPIQDMFSPSTKVELSKTILASFASQSGVTTSDPVVINSLFDLASKLHDSINALTPDDEKRQISSLVCKFLAKIDFGKDFEQFLSFYVDCRRVFANLDPVKETLVHAVLSLAMRTLNATKNHVHTKKTLSFVKACISYCHITIPSLEDPLLRLRLFILVGHVSLLNGLLPQADTLFRIAVTTVSEVPPTIASETKLISTQEPLVQLLSVLASSLVVVPGHPDLGATYLIRGLLNVLEEYPWEKGSDAKCRIYTNMLGAFAGLLQDRLPYHYPKVNSNDDLYKGDVNYVEDLQQLGSTVLESALTELSKLAEDEDSLALQRQSRCAAELFARLVADCDLQADASQAKLCRNLFSLSLKNVGEANSSSPVFNLLKQTVSSLSSRINESKAYADLYAKTSSALEAAANASASQKQQAAGPL